MPRLEWIQIEVTSFCNASCVYCPRTVYKDNWLDRHLPVSTFEKLAPLFPKTGLVFLQGWGEPLMSPHFFEMVKMAKKSGIKVGTATNGTLINQDSAARMVETGIDILAFSLAGATALNDRFRKGAEIEKVMHAIELVGRAKEQSGRSNPDIHIAYLLLRSGIDDLRALPSLTSGTGVSQVVISTLDFIPAEELKGEAIMPASKSEFNEITSLIEEVSRESARAGGEVYYQISSPGPRRLSCTEKPREALFISSDGSVSPCVFTSLPVTEASCFTVNRVEEDTSKELNKEPVHGLAFGNVNAEPLHVIWRKKGYATFRESFFKRDVSRPCLGCPKLYMHQQAGAG